MFDDSQRFSVVIFLKWSVELPFDLNYNVLERLHDKESAIPLTKVPNTEILISRHVALHGNSTEIAT